MPDYIEVEDAGGVKRKINVDEIAEQFVQRFKVQHGADGSATDVSSASPLPVGDAGSSLTVDSPLNSPVGVRLSDGASALATTSSELHIRDATARTKLGEILSTLGGMLTAEVADAGVLAAVEGLGALLSSIDSDTGGMLTALQLLDDVVAGSEMQVDVVGELPAGTKNIGQVDPRGNKAHDEADAGNPIKTGGRARTALPAAVSQDDRSDFMADKHGRQLVTEYPRDQKGEGRLNLTNTTETTILEAAGASTRWVVTGIIVTNSSATVETKVEIKDDTTAKVIVHAGTRGGGAAPPCPPGGFFIGAENKTVKVKAVTTGADVEVFVCGYKIPA